MKIESILAQSPVVPVIVVNRIEDALPLAEALVDGGLPVLEITLRSPIALQAIETRYSYRLIFAPGTIGSITWLPYTRSQKENSGLHFCENNSAVFDFGAFAFASYNFGARSNNSLRAFVFRFHHDEFIEIYGPRLFLAADF